MNSETRETYVVVIPKISNRETEGFSDFSGYRFTTAPDSKVAIKNVLYRSSNHNSREKPAAVGRVAREITNNFGALEEFAHRIEEEFFDESGKRISRFDPIYSTAQEYFLAQEMSDKKKLGLSNYIIQARSIIDAYEKDKSSKRVN